MSTKINDVAVQNSVVNATTIGATTPSTAQFITPASSDNSQNAATTAWVRGLFGSLASGNGYTYLPNGILLQWGQVTTDINAGQVSVSFPTPFPSAVFSVMACTYSTTDRITYVVNGTVNRFSFTVANNGSHGYAFWFAVGN